MDVFIFYLAGFIALLGASMVLVLKNPLRAAMALIVSLGGLSLVYLLLHAQFVATMQLLVYAGAILVLFVFVIMLLNLEDPKGKRRGVSFVASTMVLITGVALVATRVLRVKDDSFTTDGAPIASALPLDFGTVERVGMQIMTDFVI